MVVIPKNHSMVIREMLERLVDDVERGTHPLEAGWVGSKDPKADLLIELELAEKNHKGTRFRLDRIMEIKLDKPDGDVEELLNVCKDIAKAVKVEQLIAKIAGELLSSEDLQASIVLFGLWRMLETSEFPVSVDEVLRANLSPDKWYIEAPKASLDLALSVTRKWWDINAEKAAKCLSASDLTFPQIIRTDVIKEIKMVLRWEKALDLFTKKESKALAFLWWGDYLSVSERIVYPEALAFIQSNIWEHLEKDLGIIRSKIVEQVEKMIDVLSFSQFGSLKISWVEIVRLPW